MKALARALPAWTLQQLLDRRGALLRQELADVAQRARSLGGTGSEGGRGGSGGLPLVVRRCTLEPSGEEVSSQQVPPKDWLALHISCNTATRGRLAVHQPGSCEGAQRLKYVPATHRM